MPSRTWPPALNLMTSNPVLNETSCYMFEIGVRFSSIRRELHSAIKQGMTRHR